MNGEHQIVRASQTIFFVASLTVVVGGIIAGGVFACQCDIAHQFKANNLSSEAKQMGLAYSENHRGEAGAYQGGVSSAPGWSIRWQGPYNVGPLPIDVVRAARDNLKHRQRTTASTEENAKLLFKLEQAIEEYEGKSPTIGGDLNNLIPEGE